MEDEPFWISSLRLRGNDYYRRSQFFEALKCYNEILTYAAPRSTIAILYSNRSAVYYEIKEYNLCLENIKLAREAGCSPEIKSKLDRRESSCKELMKSQNNQTDDPWSFFKLSYPANEHIPFIVSCLELSQDRKFGRKIVTNQDLKAGSILAIEELAMKQVAESSQVCQYCFKGNNLSLSPNDFEPDIEPKDMYCSTECKEKAVEISVRGCRLSDMDGFQRSFYEALNMSGGSFEKLEMLLDDPDLANKTVFDFNWRNLEETVRRYQSLLAINGLLGAPLKESGEPQFQCALDPLNSEEHKRITLRFMQRLKSISILNAIGLDGQAFDVDNRENKLDIFETRSTGIGILCFGSLLNHSCDHNVDRMAVANKIVFYANGPIAKGQQLCINYGPFYASNSRDDRRKFLKLKYGFNCDCSACHNDYPLLSCSLLVDIRKSIVELFRISDTKSKFKENCDKLMKIPSETDTEEARFKKLKLFYQNIFLLSTLSGNRFINYFEPPAE